MILADKRDYKRGYTKHYNAYQILRKSNNCLKSRRLLLVYCVECGLKYKLLDKWKENNSRAKMYESQFLRRIVYQKLLRNWDKREHFVFLKQLRQIMEIM